MEYLVWGGFKETQKSCREHGHAVYSLSLALIGLYWVGDQKKQWLSPTFLCVSISVSKGWSGFSFGPYPKTLLHSIPPGTSLFCEQTAVSHQYLPPSVIHTAPCGEENRASVVTTLPRRGLGGKRVHVYLSLPSQSLHHLFIQHPFSLVAIGNQMDTSLCTLPLLENDLSVFTLKWSLGCLYMLIWIWSH